ncbi:MAG: hypothetical protein KDA41_04215 [Planctomycetales bacterium]|nr:hypothetical protein [Planctomycetales bacterium]
MVDVFPTGRFGFMTQEIDIERATLEGGEAIAGGSDRISTDGGGRVFAEFADGSLVDRDTVLAWRALLGILEEGVTRMVVPFCDARHQPVVGPQTTTYSDDTSHSDGSLFSGSTAVLAATAAAVLRATTLEVAGALPRPLLGGEWFTIVHPAKGERAYKVRTVADDGSSLTFRPPLREAVAVGEELDFSHPRCLMVQDGRAPNRLEFRRATTAAIRFVEAR